MGIIVGILIGIVLSISFFLTYSDYTSYNLLKNELNMMVESDMSNYSFMKRIDQIVEMKHNNSGWIIYIMLDKKEITICDSQLKPIVIRNKYNEKKLNYLYKRIVTSFNRDIFVNSTNFNGKVVSNNLLNNIKDNDGDNIVDTYDVKISIDDILDKINETGIESLTPEELEILKGSEGN